MQNSEFSKICQHVSMSLTPSGIDLPSSMAARGDPAIWANLTGGEPSLGLVSSGRVPAGVLLRIHDWAHDWRQHGPIVISGFHSTTEREALDVLLGGQWPAVLVLARGMVKRLRPELGKAVDDGRLLVVSPFAETVTQAKVETAAQRNRVVCALADTVLVAYADGGSKTLSLVEEVLGWGKPVVTVEHEANGHLMAMGVEGYQASGAE